MSQQARMKPLAKEIDVFVHSHGFFSNNKIYPVEMGFAEVDHHAQTRIVICDLSELPCTHKDYENNFLAYKKCHGIESPFTYKDDGASNNRPYGTPYKYMGTLIQLLYPRGTVFAVKGQSQYTILRDIVRDNFKILDIEETFGFHKKVPVGHDPLNTPPDFHRGFHSFHHEKNCAGKVAWTYAELLRDKKKFYDVWPVIETLYDDMPRQERPLLHDRCYWWDCDESSNHEDENYNNSTAAAATPNTTTTTTNRGYPYTWDDNNEEITHTNPMITPKREYYHQ